MATARNLVLAFCGAAAATAALLAAPTPARAAEEFDPEAAVDALNALFGAHPGARAAHAKGLCAEGRFTPSDAARGFANTDLFAPGDRPVTLRFSLGSGLPAATDKEKSVRGMAVRFELPDGNAMDLVTITAPVFIVRDPADFVTLVRLNVPDPATGKPDEARIKAFLAEHPESARQAEYLAKIPVPASYAATPYFAVHTFMFADPRGGPVRPARWSLEPDGGFVGLSEEQTKGGPDEFLADDLRARVGKGEAAWTVRLTLPEAGDPLDDPTTAWPEGRKQVEVGRLVVTAVDPAGGKGACDPLMFDPNVLAEGIEPSADPVLPVRSPAYAVSLSRRQTP